SSNERRYGFRPGTPVDGSARGPIRSGRESFPQPTAVRASGEADAVVEPARPALPELDHRRQHPVTAPEFWPRHVAIGVLRHQLGVPAFEVSPIRDHLTLAGGPRPEPAAERAVHEVVV